ncbi:MAG: EamA family transporter [Clostridia bacterium]|nr:EamA family transporter [Clostridia bacterium]
MNRKMALRGALLTLLGGVLWGFSGTCGQYLLQVKGLTSEYIVPVRLLCGGTLLLLLGVMKQGKGVFDAVRNDAPGILVFSILGMAMCQYTYYSAIDASNAGTATVLQYTSPAMILVWVSLRGRRRPRPIELAAIALALCGTWLLATHGRPGSMMLSADALFWGLLSAVCLSVCTVQPGELLARYGSALVTGWGMLLGGILLFALFRWWAIPAQVDAMAVLALIVVVITGTLAYVVYLEGVRCVGAKKGSLYASVEPVAAAVFSALLMGAAFAPMDLVGFACILSTVFLLAADKKD